MNTLLFSVNLFGSHPDDNNDDCYTRIPSFARIATIAPISRNTQCRLAWALDAMATMMRWVTNP